ncbi:acetoacetate--CoA ligase [Paracoccaceae bacterium]|nr:acetoacetate--CoA ligase [Paracoccaceae bacterium]
MDFNREILWRPSKRRSKDSALAKYMSWLKEHYSLNFSTYQDLWEWSTNDLEQFWETIWLYFDLKSSQSYSKIQGQKKMPGAEWFIDCELNYVEQLLRAKDITPHKSAIVSYSETHGKKTLTWSELSQQVSSVADHFKKMGVKKGDRIVAVLPNTPAALIAFLATASLGAIWSICAPDMGHVAILDRFKQIEPKILIAQDGYIYADKKIDRREVLKTIIDGLSSLQKKIILPVVGSLPEDALSWDSLLTQEVDFSPVQVPFDHPLWIVYSSGTTGNPKPIVHGHGGILVVAAAQSLNMDLTCMDRFAWLTSSGWIMWNAQWIALSQGATVVLFDFAPNRPDMLEVWRYVGREKLSYFGAGAAFFTACLKAGVTPRTEIDLRSLKSLGSTGSPLSTDGYQWIYKSVKADVWLAPISGGTDLAAAFVVGNPMAVVRNGEMQAKALGIAVYSFNEEGEKLVGKVGELVCTKPIPSMPLYFWGDKQNKRLISSYYDTYPGVWRHGDWIEFTGEGQSIIYGRSDATINRSGLRLGSAEIYQAVESLNQVQDSLVIDLEFLNKESLMILFVVLDHDLNLDEHLSNIINQTIINGVSIRFIPNKIIQVDQVPRTLSGKKLEIPVKKLFLGGKANNVVNKDSMANPDSFDTFVKIANNYLSDSGI